MNQPFTIKVALLWVTLLLPAAAMANSQQGSYRQLAVDDFRVDERLERPSVMKVASFCTLQFGVRSSEKGERATARIASWGVSSGFHRPESVRIHPRKWKATPAELSRTLAHEQGHLDINEAHANILRARKSFPTGQGKTPAAAAADLKRKIEAILAEAELRCAEMQDRYDRETNHGIREKTQRSWEAQIAADLRHSRRSGTLVARGDRPRRSAETLP